MLPRPCRLPCATRCGMPPEPRCGPWRQAGSYGCQGTGSPRCVPPPARTLPNKPAAISPASPARALTNLLGSSWGNMGKRGGQRVYVPYLIEHNKKTNAYSCVKIITATTTEPSRGHVLFFFCRGVRRPVSRVLSAPCDAGRPFLWDAHRCAPHATNPGGGAGTPLRHAACAAPPATPIRSCSRWGLPCRRRCQRRGALLPHRFTLAQRQSGLATGALTKVRTVAGQHAWAVCFLWHFP